MADTEQTAVTEETQGETPADTPKKNKRGLHIFLGILLGILGAALVAYLGFTIYFTKHFAYNTTINGMDVACYTSDMVEDEIETIVDSYCLTITGRLANDDYINGSDIDLTVLRGQGAVEMLSNQNPFKWPYYAIEGQALQCDTLFTYDSDKLSDVFSNLDCTAYVNQVMPVDAHVSEYDASTGFTVVEAVEGTAIDKATARDAVENAVNSLETSLDLDAIGAYIEPTLYADDANLIATADALNDYSKASINYDLGDTSFVLDATTYADWLQIDEEYQVTLDEEKVAEYVDGLADKYDTWGKSKYLHTSYGYNVTITSHLKYGWQLDQETEVAQIVEDLNSGETVTRDLNWTHTAASHTNYDYGDSYVEINLTDQKLFLISNGKVVVETPFVSGNESKGWGTPCGAYGLTYKTKDAVLKGDNYATPVSYWMPFNGNIGMHDATWRSNFGGEIYKTSGSHGCINLPYSAAKEIYEYVSTGFPVLCYYTPADTTIREATPYSGPDESEEPIAGQTTTTDTTTGTTTTDTTATAQ